MIKKDKIPPEERWRLPPGMNMNATVYGPPLPPKNQETEAAEKKAEGKKKKRGYGWFSAAYLLSFVSYFCVLWDIFMTDRWFFIEPVFLFFYGMVLFQVLYIFLLRKFDSVSLGRSIARFFMYAFLAGSSVILAYYLDIFVNGHSTYTFIGGYYLDTYYGFEAWEKDAFGNLFFLPPLVVFISYEIGYVVISERFRRKNTQSKEVSS